MTPPDVTEADTDIIDGPVGRCAYRAEERADPLIGTAFPASRLLLVEDPGPWGRAGLADSSVPPDVARALAAAAQGAGLRIQLIRRTGRTGPGPAGRAVALVDTRDGRQDVRWSRVTDDADLVDLADLSGIEHRGEPSPEPVYLVCTHGNRDVCCAVRGRATATALAELRPAQVWETTHLGGDRFAANLVVLPSGLAYGRVPTHAAADLVAAVEAGTVLLPWFRGRIGLSPTAQSAVAHALGALGLSGQGDVHVESEAELGGNASDVQLGTSVGQVRVRVVRERVEAVGLTCSRPGPGWFTRHVATGLARLD